MIQPNISQDGLRLLWLDRFDVIPFAFAQDRAPIDVSPRVFKLVFYEEDGITEVLTLDNARLALVSGRTDKRTWRPTATDRAALQRTKTYKVVLYEILTEGSGQGAVTYDFYYAHFEFKWWTLPDRFVEGMPRKPPTALINHVTATGTVVVLNVYEVPMGPVPYPSVVAALNAVLPSGQTDQPCYVVVNGVKQFFVKDAGGLWPQLSGDLITLQNYQSFQ